MLHGKNNADYSEGVHVRNRFPEECALPVAARPTNLPRSAMATGCWPCRIGRAIGLPTDSRDLMAAIELAMTT